MRWAICHHSPPSNGQTRAAAPAHAGRSKQPHYDPRGGGAPPGCKLIRQRYFLIRSFFYFRFSIGRLSTFRFQTNVKVRGRGFDRRRSRTTCRLIFDQVRIGNQSENRKGDWPQHSGVVPAPLRRGN
jgi:hypothetical protein